jgi:hypothetical protein
MGMIEKEVRCWKRKSDYDDIFVLRQFLILPEGCPLLGLKVHNFLENP